MCLQTYVLFFSNGGALAQHCDIPTPHSGAPRGLGTGPGGTEVLEASGKSERVFISKRG